MYKVASTSIIFLIILLLTKRLKLCEFSKSILPFLVLLIPYLIFPNFTLQFIENLFVLEDLQGKVINELPDLGNPILNFLLHGYLLVAQAIQPSQLLFYSFVLIIISSYIKEKKISKIEINNEYQ
jgi:hypothetical protein